MMDALADEWHPLGQEFARLASRIDRVNSVNLNAADLRAEAAQIALRYLQRVRHVLLEAELTKEVSVLDEAFKALLNLSEGRNAVSSYKKQIKRIRKTMPAITAGLAVHAGSSRDGRKGPSAEEQKLVSILSEMVPTAAISYRQALDDLQQDKRVSFRGPALELREVLREVLDNMAPDKEVIAAPGYKQEKDRHGPTMKQKVRFILKAREVGSAAIEVVEDTATTLDAAVGDLTRSVYNFGSVATHVASERRRVLQLKRYVDAVLHDLLELS